MLCWKYLVLNREWPHRWNKNNYLITGTFYVSSVGKSVHLLSEAALSDAVLCLSGSKTHLTVRLEKGSWDWWSWRQSTNTSLPVAAVTSGLSECYLSFRSTTEAVNKLISVRTRFPLFTSSHTTNITPQKHTEYCVCICYRFYVHIWPCVHIHNTKKLNTRPICIANISVYMVIFLIIQKKRPKLFFNLAILVQKRSIRSKMEHTGRCWGGASRLCCWWPSTKRTETASRVTVRGFSYPRRVRFRMASHGKYIVK